MKFIAYLKCLIFQVCKFINDFNIGSFFVVLFWLWKDSLRKSWNLLKHFGVFVHSVFRYQSLQGGALTVAADAPVEARECRVESAVCVCGGGGSLFQKLDGCSHVPTPQKTGVAHSAEVA